MPARPATFNHLAVGDVEVTFVPDGHLAFSAVDAYPGSAQGLWDAHPQYLDDQGLLVMSLGVLLVRTAGQAVLVDLGYGPTTVEVGDGTPGSATIRGRGGDLLANLAALGVSPADVDAVLLSHLHADHTGWIVDPATATGDGANPGRSCFPAPHYLSQAEWDHWSSGAPSAGPAPTPEQLAVLGSRLVPLDDGATPVPGVTAMATPGHTPGHLSFVISSGGERAVVLGDALHCPVEIAEPELVFVADVDPALAQRTRIRIEEELLRPGTHAAAPHFPDLVFGRLLPADGRPMWHFPETQVRAVPATEAG